MESKGAAPDLICGTMKALESGRDDGSLWTKQAGNRYLLGSPACAGAVPAVEVAGPATSTPVADG